jgi:hypothetical protein
MFVQSSGVQASRSGSWVTTNQVSLSLQQPSGAGDLLVLNVGWGGFDAGVVGVADSSGDTFQPIFTSTSSTWFQEALYYSEGVSEGPHTVTVTTSTPPYVFLELRAYEYSGVAKMHALDRFAAAAGRGCSGDGIGAGSGFTARPVYDGGGSLAEDQVVSEIGSYTAEETCGGAPLLSTGAVETTRPDELVFSSAQVGGSDAWVMQLATFTSAAPDAG